MYRPGSLSLDVLVCKMGTRPVDYFAASLEKLTDYPKKSRSSELEGHPGRQASHYTENRKGPHKSHNLAPFSDIEQDEIAGLCTFALFTHVKSLP